MPNAQPKLFETFRHGGFNAQDAKGCAKVAEEKVPGFLCALCENLRVLCV
jgi:hypothetical protein